MFPVVALGLSTVFEGYAWSLSSVSGLGLVLLGNGLVLGIKLPFTRRNKAWDILQEFPHPFFLK